jgi:hypothetical protein
MIDAQFLAEIETIVASPDGVSRRRAKPVSRSA